MTANHTSSRAALSNEAFAEAFFDNMRSRGIFQDDGEQHRLEDIAYWANVFAEARPTEVSRIYLENHAQNLHGEERGGWSDVDCVEFLRRCGCQITTVTEQGCKRAWTYWAFTIPGSDSAPRRLFLKKVVP